MNGIRRLISVLLVAVLCAAVVVMPAAAAEVTQDGLKIVLTTDAETYKDDGRIIVTVTATNTNSYPMTNVVLTVQIPAGYRLAQGSAASKTIPTLAAGASDSLRAVVEPISQPTEPSINNTSRVTTQIVMCLS